MIIDNFKMTEALALADSARYYHWCVDLSLAGEDYKVNEIVCFVNDESDPLSDFVQVKKYDMGCLLILLYTEKNELIDECMDYVDAIAKGFPEIEIRTPYPSFFESDRIKGKYAVVPVANPSNPVFYIHSADELVPNRKHEAVEVHQYRGDADKAAIFSAVNGGRIDVANMNADMFVPCTVFKDVKWYIMCIDGEIAGYLRAECGYGNIYDIGWLYVEPRYRGHGYAVDLVTYFSKDMFARQAIPHYGYAVSEESVSVAKKCGYICDNVKIECRCLLPVWNETK